MTPEMSLDERDIDLEEALVAATTAERMAIIEANHSDLLGLSIIAGIVLNFSGLNPNIFRIDE